MLIITHSFFPRQPGNEKICRIPIRSPPCRNLVQQAASHFVFSHQRKLFDSILRNQRQHIRRHTEAELDSPARERLAVVASTTDGFELARRDVELRREGDVLGARQSGVRSSLKLLSVVRDEEIIADAREAAADIVAHGSENADLLDAVSRLESTEQADYLERA